MNITQVINNHPGPGIVINIEVSSFIQMAVWHAPPLATRSPRPPWWKHVIIVGAVRVDRDANLLEVVGTQNGVGGFSCSFQAWEQHCDEQRDDRYDHQQFNQGEASYNRLHMRIFCAWHRKIPWNELCIPRWWTGGLYLGNQNPRV